MNDRLAHLVDNLFAFDVTADLLSRDFVQQALAAAALLALVAGLIGPFIVMRQMSFAVHGSSELSLTGASFALLTGLNVGLGALVGSALAAILFGFLGQRARERDSAIGVVLAFGLGLAVLFIHLYPGRAGTSFALLTGQIVGVGYSGLTLLGLVTVAVIAVLAISYRPLLFATADPEVAAARGVPVRALGIVFAGLVGVVAAQGVAGDVAAHHAGGGRGPGLQFTGRHDRHIGGVRRDRGGRGPGAVAGARCSGIGFRHHHFVRHLSAVLGAEPPPPRSRSCLTAAGTRLEMCRAST